MTTPNRADLPLAALILVGGYGTRLRPLTFTRSKPLVEFCNRPMCEYMIDALTAAGCRKIVFALSELQHDFAEYIASYQAAHPSVELIASVETEPLGTAGPIALAREHLRGHRFFMLNSDVISEYPFRELLEFHIQHGGEGTIMSWDVEDPSRFGVILSEENGRITRFVEKPQTFVGRSINAGHYIFEPEVIDRVRPVPTSIEREIFPQIAAEGRLFVMKLRGFWMDIGTPSAFISGISMFLRDEKKVLVDASAKVGSGCQIGPNAVIGPDVVIGDNCCIENAVVLRGARIGCGCCIRNTIVGWKCRIGNWANLSELCILGQDVAVRDKVVLRGANVCPHKTVERSCFESINII